MEKKNFTQILNREMDIAMGCTEPASVALCAAYASSHLNETVSSIDVYASVNIIKNAMAAGIPGTDVTGVACAASLGAVCADTTHGLLIMDRAGVDDVKKALDLLNEGRVNVYVKQGVDKLYTEVRVIDTENNVATSVISGTHTNLSFLKINEKELISSNTINKTGEDPIDSMISAMTLENIYDFVNSIDIAEDDLEIIAEAIEINTEISKKGAISQYNLHVGQNIKAMQDRNLIGTGLVEEAMRRTANGIDARMGGAKQPVITNSGSGNQGITATIPVLTAAEFLGVDEETRFKAVTLSHLCAIYIHRNFGLLSALCGATIAGTAAACGITYLMGGDVRQIGFAINNMLGTVTGMLCDGAKPDCALKVSACVNAAILSAYMAVNDISVKSNEGIVETEASKTIDNFTRLGNAGSDSMDKIILDIMLNKGGCKNVL